MMLGAGVTFDRDSALRCPFVRAVAEGRISEATAIARRGPEPADPGSIPVLLAWAAKAAAGEAPFGEGSS